jgi:hypothetical protein
VPSHRTIDEALEEAARRLDRVTAVEELGFVNATDVIGRVAAWNAAGLPILGQADQIAVDADEAVAG